MQRCYTAELYLTALEKQLVLINGSSVSWNFKNDSEKSPKNLAEKESPVFSALQLKVVFFNTRTGGVPPPAVCYQPLRRVNKPVRVTHSQEWEPSQDALGDLPCARRVAALWRRCRDFAKITPSCEMIHWVTCVIMACEMLQNKSVSVWDEVYLFFVMWVDLLPRYILRSYSCRVDSTLSDSQTRFHTTKQITEF